MSKVTSAAQQVLPDIPYLKFGEEVTLTNCDREPIHIPGHAQPHGMIVVLDVHSEGLNILQVSDNLSQLGIVAAQELLGQEATALFDSVQLVTLKNAMKDARLEANPLYLFTGPICGTGSFHVTAHTLNGVLTIELETEAQAGSFTTLPDSHALLRQALLHLSAATNLSAYYHAVCEAVQKLNGFDRVMLYRFHEDGHGEVIAEVISEADTREPYLGLHYPESDIPKQARALFRLNTIRLMPDALYVPSPIIPNLNPQTGQPLDLTYCVLRGYSRMYTEYLTNMKSRASMSLAIVRDNALWGLIACHHQTPRLIAYDSRAACELLGDVVSLHISDKVTQEENEYRQRIQNVHRNLVESRVWQGDFLSGLTHEDGKDSGRTVLSLLEAGGCAVLSGKDCRLLRLTPPREEVIALVQWLNTRYPEAEAVWATEALADVFPMAKEWLDCAAGLLALRLTTDPPYGGWILWFRPEEARTVNWAGNPNKPYDIGPLGDSLTPRKSFELWQETVRGHSRTWKAADIEGALQLRQAIDAQITARRADELERLNNELALSNFELDSFAYVTSHDLKEPLRGIANYIRFLREDHGDQLTPEVQEKLDTVVRLTRRMDNLLDSLLHYSQVGRQKLTWVETDLNQLLNETLESLHPRLQKDGVAVRMPRPLPTDIRCDPVQVSELLGNLIINAAKYNDRAAGEKWVEIGWIGASPEGLGKGPLSKRGIPSSAPVFFVRDNGIGIPEAHFLNIFRIFKRLHGRNDYEGGTGAGLTISQTIAERHGGKIWVESVVDEGSTFFFTLG